MPSNNFTIYEPTTQAQKLAFFENQITALYITPDRNFDFNVMPHDADHTVHSIPNYNYNGQIDSYEIISDNDSSSLNDKYSIFRIIENDSSNALQIVYNL